MAVISRKARKALSGRSFALPAQRKFPIENASHVRNAAARLEQLKSNGKISSADYATAKRNIASAAKRFGVKSQYNMDLGQSDVSQAAPVAAPRKLHVRADLAEGGSLHIRHLRDDLYAFPGVEVASLSDAPPAEAVQLVWNQIAKTGTFRGHKAGPFELNEKVFSEIIANFERERQPIPVDHEHQSELPAGELGPDGAPAMGWIRDLKIINGNLWGNVDWNAKGRDQVKSGEYRYFSPAIRFGSKDRVTGMPIGARLSSGALTNSPFLTGMQPMAASAAGDLSDGELVAAASRAAGMSIMSDDTFSAKLRACLRLNELASMHECSDQLDRLRSVYETAPHARAMHQGVDLSGYTDSLCSLMSMPANSSVEQMLDAVQEMIDAAIERHEAIYHEGAEPDDGEPTNNDDEGGAGMTNVAASLTAADAASTNGGDAMSAELIAQLKDTNDKVTTLSAKNAELVTKAETAEKTIKANESEIAEKTLKLNASEQRAATLEGELKLMREVEAKRVEETQVARRDEAFDTHKDAQKLTDSHKAMMLSYLKSDPSGFEAVYPRITADKKHLLRDLTGSRVPTGNGGNGNGSVESGETITLSLKELSRRIASEKKVSLETAQREAMRIIAARRAG